MANKKETLEKYFIGFDFSDKEKPTLLVGEHTGKVVVAINYITEKAVVEELYTKLTKRPIK